MSEITQRFTHWTAMKEETGKVNHLGHYVPAGLHKCQLCQTYDDPRRVRIQLENGRSFNLCWTCASPYLEELLSIVFDPEEINPNNDQSALAYPKNPHIDTPTLKSMGFSGLLTVS
jgi:hypothetical protein